MIQFHGPLCCGKSSVAALVWVLDLSRWNRRPDSQPTNQTWLCCLRCSYLGVALYSPLFAILVIRDNHAVYQLSMFIVENCACEFAYCVLWNKLMCMVILQNGLSRLCISLKKKNCLRVLLSLVSSFLCFIFFVQPLNRKFLHIGTWKVNHICFKVNM